MPMSPFSAVASLLASGPGILLLSMLAASIVLIWDWRWALASTVALLLGVSSIVATLHSPTTLVTVSQWLAILVAGLLLGLSVRFHRAGATAQANSNWLLRLIALGFLLGVWWVIDPGVSLPLFSQVETDLLIWIGLCGLLILALSAAPFHTGIGLLLLTAPIQAMAPVLLAGSGLAVIIGIAQILLALACAYMTLTQPAPRQTERLIAPTQVQIAPSEPTTPGERPLRLFPRSVTHHPALPARETVTTVDPRLEPQAPAEERI